METYDEGQNESRCLFMDLEKANDRVSVEELWYRMRKLGAAKKYVRSVQDTYKDNVVVKCANKGGGGITSGISSELNLVYSGVGQVEG